MSRSDEEGRRGRLLRRIAQVLDLPVERLWEPTDDEDAGSDVEQAAELLRLFEQIRDVQARRRCLAFVRQAAGARVDLARGLA